ncbi:hypothetical protein EVJ58_g3410 [Rhodofomes roseus]|uniref:Uncharacterized protein n=1 Tax=Rhodofomes roseus TaxID=34475 RepID=A0A4Y9YKV9_9APHY|nr:hypothetical protein EVJ58_g3410 [Rhodofomes roseus]
MSTVDARETIHSHMLRSNTPASNEKVLLYLEGLQKTPPQEEENLDLDDDAGGDDIRSDVQEGSNITRTIPIQTTGIPEREPGPNDPPGPKFESFGSSFGNFGPLPTGDGFGGFVQEFGMTPAAAVPLPASVAEIPSSPTASRMRHNGSRASNKSPSNADMGGMVSPKSASRALSPTRTATGGGERPWSPRTAASQGQSLKSRNTHKTNRTVYPPLPESILEENMSKAHTQRVPSPVDRQTNKSPSLAPSDSVTEALSKRTVRAAQEASQKPPKSMKSTSQANGGEHYATSQRGRSQAPMSPRSQAAPMSSRSQAAPMSTHRSAYEELQRAAASAAMSPTRSKRSVANDPQATPTPSRPISPADDLNADERRMVDNVLTGPQPRSRTSYALSTVAPSALEPEVQNSHFHDMELCQLLHALDQPMGEPVKKAVRKAVRARVKKLGMKNDNESIRQYRKSYHDHDPSVHLAAALQLQPTSKRSTQIGTSAEPPEWAKDLIDGMINMRERLDTLAPKIERSLRSSRGESYVTDGRGYPAYGSQAGGYNQSPMTQTVNMATTMGDESMYQPVDTELRTSTNLHTLPGSMHHHDGSLHDAIPEEDVYDDEDDLHGHLAPTDDQTRGMGSEYMPNDRTDSPGQQYLEEQFYRLRERPTGSQSVATHKTWEVAREDGDDYDDGDAQAAVTESGLPEIPDGNTGVYTDRRGSPPLPPIPQDGSNMPDHQLWQPGDYAGERNSPPPWQRVHQRLLSWAIVWRTSELDNAVNSTMRGMQVDEVALSIWSTQTYKRYVRAKMTDSPPGRVDRLFVPPNMADAISAAVYNGRHGDACAMLRDLWAPFGLEGIPRLLIVLAKHRNDESHWVVHRFSLPDGSLTTYDTYPERCLPDGRPLGWWFAIRIAWPDAIYPSPDHLMQKMVRLHRPMQLAIDNSVAAAGIWRNLLMGSRAERSLDLERLRDLINTEVKNLRQRKEKGKLSIGQARPNWEDMH